MKILITGAKGFIGKNLIARLNEIGGHTIYTFDIDSSIESLDEYTKDCEFVYHFAAVHRPKDPKEFDDVNHRFFDDLLVKLKKNNNKCPVLYTSSIQATNGSEYGKSKLAAEADLRAYGEENNSRIIIYRLTNTFGKWATPNQHSVVATFCYNIVRNLPITVSDRSHKMYFYYIDDVVDSFVKQLSGEVEADQDGIYRLKDEQIYEITLGELADTLTYFNECQKNGTEALLDTPTKERLYITYKSYLEESK